MAFRILIAFIIFTYIFLMLIIGRYLTYLDLFLPRKKPNGKIELTEYAYEDIEFQSPDDLTLRGWFIRSKNNPENKTLFIVPGWTRTRSRYLHQIKFFVDNGYHVFTYDQRSHGASDTGRITFGPNEGRDLITAVQYATDKLGINRNKIGAVGFSLGAISIIYAAKTQLFKAVVLEGVFSNSYDMGEAILLSKVGKKLTKFIGYAFFWVGAMVWTLGKYKHTSPVDHIGQVSPTPILLIRGNNDQTVPAYSAEKMINALREPKEIWVHDSGHTWAFDAYPTEYKKRVLGFINKYV